MFSVFNPTGFLGAQNSNITDNLVGSNGTLLGWGGGVYVADHCTNGVCGHVTATLTNNLINMNHAHEACDPPSHNCCSLSAVTNCYMHRNGKVLCPC